MLKRTIHFAFLLALLVTACGAPAPDPQPPDDPNEVEVIVYRAPT